MKLRPVLIVTSGLFAVLLLMVLWIAIDRVSAGIDLAMTPDFKSGMHVVHNASEIVKKLQEDPAWEIEHNAAESGAFRGTWKFVAWKSTLAGVWRLSLRYANEAPIGAFNVGEGYLLDYTYHSKLSTGLRNSLIPVEEPW